MIIGILLGYILNIMEPPTIIWIAYGSFWVVWLIKVIVSFVKAVIGD